MISDIPWAAIPALFLALTPFVLTPGASTVLVAQHSAAGNHGGVVATIAGTCTGIVVHATLSAVGLSALVMASTAALTVVRVVGAIFLVGLGVYLLATSGTARNAEAPLRLPPPRTRAYVHAVVGNVVNPKAAAVYLTLPVQVLRPGQSLVLVTFLLAGVHAIMLVPWLSLWAVVLGSARRYRRLRLVADVVRRAGGAVLIALGIRTAAAV